MKKRIVTIALVVALLATCFAGTYAYLTDTDYVTNVMTMGSVYIEQIEQERDATGKLVSFTQGKPAYPIVGSEYDWDHNVYISNFQCSMLNANNIVDKIVTIKNTGKTDAYVRTIVAIEAPEEDPNNLIMMNYNPTIAIETGHEFFVKINGVDFYVVEFVYQSALAAGTESIPSLLQVWLKSGATNEDCAKFGDTWEILTLSQAVQKAGFDDAQTALDEAFGEANATNVAGWFTALINNP